MRESAKSDVAFINAGGLRADLPEGEVTYGNVIDAFPFPNRVVLMDLSGKDILGVLEQSMTLERGMIQASGLIAHYDLDRPKGQRVTDLEIGGKPVDPEQIYKVAVADLLAEGARTSISSFPEWDDYPETRGQPEDIRGNPTIFFRCPGAGLSQTGTTNFQPRRAIKYHIPIK